MFGQSGVSRGDIVLFQFASRGRLAPLSKIVIAGPGDSVGSAGLPHPAFFIDEVIPPGYFYVISGNPNNRQDSRTFGLIPSYRIIAVADKTTLPAGRPIIDVTSIPVQVAQWDSMDIVNEYRFAVEDSLVAILARAFEFHEADAMADAATTSRYAGPATAADSLLFRDSLHAVFVYDLTQAKLDSVRMAIRSDKSRTDVFAREKARETIELKRRLSSGEFAQ